METFYRVQNANGIGPYQDGQNAAMMYRHSFDLMNHPSPQKSGGYGPTGTDICGFRTMQDLFAWFGGWLPGLLKNGYQIVKANGTLRYEDARQVVFQRIDR